MARRRMLTPGTILKRRKRLGIYRAFRARRTRAPAHSQPEVGFEGGFAESVLETRLRPRVEYFPLVLLRTEQTEGLSSIYSKSLSLILVSVLDKAIVRSSALAPQCFVNAWDNQSSGITAFLSGIGRLNQDRKLRDLVTVRSGQSFDKCSKIV